MTPTAAALIGCFALTSPAECLVLKRLSQPDCSRALREMADARAAGRRVVLMVNGRLVDHFFCARGPVQ